MQALVSAPEFQNAANQVVPDPSTYADWFKRADEERRKLAVGARRYAAMKERLGAHPEWEHFLHDDGSLLTLDAIRGETHAERIGRVNRLKTEIARRGEQVRQVARLGFVP